MYVSNCIYTRKVIYFSDCLNNQISCKIFLQMKFHCKTLKYRMSDFKFTFFLAESKRNIFN